MKAYPAIGGVIFLYMTFLYAASKKLTGNSDGSNNPPQ
ncbi:hypothetical protein DCCM_3447 [Desulfocucumis palustris]|uniref:Uncharacterized protein n=1 Tax=Desulfocucumis palustris TaxID=1898651 RepID=A0A2L2XDP1_9FIRM|nr:hypothetical protein DCCM_3447 [Desulfocucumis palustris]